MQTVNHKNMLRICILLLKNCSYFLDLHAIFYPPPKNTRNAFAWRGGDDIKEQVNHANLSASYYTGYGLQLCGLFRSDSRLWTLSSRTLKSVSDGSIFSGFPVSCLSPCLQDQQLTTEAEKHERRSRLQSCWIPSFDIKSQINNSLVNKSCVHPLQWAKWNAALISVTGDTCAAPAISAQNGCCLYGGAQVEAGAPGPNVGPRVGEDIPVSLNSRRTCFWVASVTRTLRHKRGLKKRFPQTGATFFLPPETLVTPVPSVCLPSELEASPRCVWPAARPGVCRGGHKHSATHAADVRRPFLWLSSLHTPPPPGPDTPMSMFHQPPRAPAAVITASQRTPSPPLVSLPLSDSFLHCPALHWRCPCRWMPGMGPRVGAAVTPVTDDGIYAPRSFGYIWHRGRARTSCMKHLVRGPLMAWKCKPPSWHSLKGVGNMQKRHFGLSHILSECTVTSQCCCWVTGGEGGGYKFSLVRP